MLRGDRDRCLIAASLPPTVWRGAAAIIIAESGCTGVWITTAPNRPTWLRGSDR
jgi:hypothetical protein